MEGKMPNEVSVYKAKYYIERFDESDALKITEEQYQGLEKVLLDSNMKFVKIGDQIINTGSIKRVLKVAEKPNTEKYDEVGSNPLYREWASGDKLMSFKEFVNKRG